MTTRLALDEEQQQFAEVLDAITRERVAPLGHDIDAQGHIPEALVALLHEHERHLAAVPDELGGGGRELRPGLIAVERLASGSAAGALVVAVGQAASTSLV